MLTHLALALVFCLVTFGRAEAATIFVPAGGNLQTAINAANPGDTIVLTPGVTYVGNFELPNKAGSSFITIQTSPSGLPGSGARISPANAPGLAKLRSPSTAPVLRTQPGAHHWRIELIEFLPNGEGDIIALGDWTPQNTLAVVPHNLVIDRCYIHGDPGATQKRGIALNSASTTVTGSYIADIKSGSQDSQAIAGWNGPGPYTITNNYLEASGENVMFGGGDPAIPGLVPSDITIANNAFAKQTAWRAQQWIVKNLFELKNARRVTIQNNTFDYNWQEDQSGVAILFTVRNQDGGCPWCQVENVVFEENIVRHVAGGITILGFDDTPGYVSQQTRGITIRNNLFVDVDPENWGGSGWFLLLFGGPANITVDHNTVIQDHAAGFVTAEGPPIHGFIFTNNLVRHGAFGISGTGHAPGNDTIAAYFPGSVIVRNVIAEGNPAIYPPDNQFPSFDFFRSQFVSYDGGDYRLISSSPWRGAGTDGRDLGRVMEPVVPCDPNDGRKADLIWRETQNGDLAEWVIEGTQVVVSQVLAYRVPLAWQMVGRGDVNGDGFSDLVWRQTQTGDVAVWFIGGRCVVGVPIVGAGVPLTWQIAGVGDVDGDGKADLVWRHTQTGDVAVWLMDGASVKQGPVVASGVPLAWQIVELGDVDGDNKSDLIWRHTQAGHVSVWLMNGATVKEGPLVAADVPLAWVIAGVGDLDADGNADLLWRHAQTGDVAAWLMNGATVKQGPLVASGVPLAWQIADVHDVDGDGKADLVWRHTQTGDVAAWLMDSVFVRQAPVIAAGVPLAWQIQ